MAICILAIVELIVAIIFLLWLRKISQPATSFTASIQVINQPASQASLFT
jgi:hypothetical protein